MPDFDDKLTFSNDSQDNQKYVSKYKKTIIRNYNQAYDKWKNTPKNSYNFTYKKLGSEVTFISGEGFIHETPADKEKSILSKTFGTIGTAMLLYFLITLTLPKILVLFAHFFNLNDINYFLITQQFSGTSSLVTVFSLLTVISKYSIPFCYLIVKLKMPLRAAIPFKPDNISDIPLGIAILFSLLGILGFIKILFPEIYISELYSENFILFSKSSELSNIYNVHYFLNIIIFSILSEMLIHGVILQLLRQFGDVFAVFITFIISVTACNPLQNSISYFIVSAVAGVFVLRTNSTLTGIFIVLAYKLYITGFDILNKASLNEYLIIYICCFLIIGIAGNIAICTITKQPRKLIMNKTNLKFSSKLECAMTFQTIHWCIITIAYYILIIYFKVNGDF